MSQCSFCGRTEEQVKKLIAGEKAFICDECVAVCSKIVARPGPLNADEASDAFQKPGSRRPKAGWSGYDPAPRDAS